MAHQKNHRIAILGSVGAPARYGGFETLADNLVQFHAAHSRPEALCVYCSRPAYPDQPMIYGNATLRYSRLRANGASSVLYDAATLRDAIAKGSDVALLLGVSGAIALPLLARKGTRIVTHVDGLEWRRKKWSKPARAFLRWSERLAVQHSDAIIADNPAIATYLRRTYRIEPEVIAYGGDHGQQARQIAPASQWNLPKDYALALCRIEPENNIRMILAACQKTATPLVFVGNWESSAYGRALKQQYSGDPGLRLLDPIYGADALFTLRSNAAVYIHGHAAGGTNPALVEMMHFGRPTLAFECVFNRSTTAGAAQFFTGEASLVAALQGPTPCNGDALREIARRDYLWADVGAQYFELFNRLAQRRAATTTRPETTRGMVLTPPLPLQFDGQSQRTKPR
ncbi:DUF1972 domain-containing protein [Gymnodinialimonas sp. 57CJ19]|uniref:DUF1972 domain-containing protein n=1 Tax=Gymnodinialimonas sp. 57CJ19 TaxID=3138498 RepID=UPI0031345655